MDNKPTTYSVARYIKLFDYIGTRTAELATIKGGEYAGSDDRLANFRRNGERLGIPMEMVWAVYASKHWDSILQYIQDANKKVNRPRAEPMVERALDMIVYLTLFIAMEDEKKAIDLD